MAYSSNMGGSSSSPPEIERESSAMEVYLNEVDGKGGAGEDETVPDEAGPEEMDEGQFKASVKASIDEAVDYIDGFIAPQRAKATASTTSGVVSTEGCTSASRLSPARLALLI